MKTTNKTTRATTDKKLYTASGKYGVIAWSTELKERKNSPITRAFQLHESDDEPHLSFFQHQAEHIKQHLATNREQVNQAVDELSKSYDKDAFIYNLLSVFGYQHNDESNDTINYAQLKLWYLNDKKTRSLNRFIVDFIAFNELYKSLTGELYDELIKDEEIKAKNDKIVKPNISYEPTQLIADF